MNAEQQRMVQVVLVIVGCFAIYSYTMSLPVIHMCDWTGLQIQDRIGHEVTFTYHNGTVNYYCCVNASLLAFQQLIDSDQIDQIVNVQVRCPMCGMLMDWDDSMIVWVYSIEYLNPTTSEPTIVPLCGDVQTTMMCESHFLDTYGGTIITNPFEWPEG